MSLALASTTAVTSSSSSSPSSSPIEEDGVTLPSCALRQQPVSITLNGPSILSLTIVLLFSIHCVGSIFTECLVLLAPLLLILHNDYENFLNLGPGGTPATFYGYLQITWWRLWALHDPFTPPPSPSSHGFPSGILHCQDLPYRPGPRPIVAGIAPQRQLDQPGAADCYHTLRRAMIKLGARNPSKFGTERSCLEKHGLALFAKHALRTNCQGEIVHVHDSDHSMHMCLNPHDIKEILCKGWGQMHPLARKGWVLQMPVASNFVMIYAPRNEHELQIVFRIIEAAIWYTSEERVSLT
ncbi:hypothetical protein AAL_02358 [Moelleriella libera RCEF 2490]|uniref:Luciferase domain-containing protein n=1 Tax=Moelleriella libera RCEF 2490 TaxID=1081109 RepID=A0A168EHQ4_9HYPO|nr:hypothetical protein AAL_02358 [Moelleriella libera RCEF 2490]